MLKNISSIFDIRRENKRILFIMLVCFLISFGVVHSYSILIGKSIFFHGYQIHHFYFGMLFLTCGGLIGTLNKRMRVKLLAGALMGIGVALFADEIGLLLNCTSIHRSCTYLFPDSTDIIGTIAIILIVILSVISRSDEQPVIPSTPKPASEPLE